MFFQREKKTYDSGSYSTPQYKYNYTLSSLGVPATLTKPPLNNFELYDKLDINQAIISDFSNIKTSYSYEVDFGYYEAQDKIGTYKDVIARYIKRSGNTLYMYGYMSSEYSGYSSNKEYISKFQLNGANINYIVAALA